MSCIFHADVASTGKGLQTGKLCWVGTTLVSVARCCDLVSVAMIPHVKYMADCMKECMSNFLDFIMLENYFLLPWMFAEKMSHRTFSCSARRLVRDSLLITFLAITASVSEGKEAGETLNAASRSANPITNPKQKDSTNQNKETGDQEICRLVIRIDFQKTDNTAAAQLRADIKAGVFADYAINEVRNNRLRKSPKISVPVGRNRYRVWYGYSERIRAAVLTNAGALSPVKQGSVSHVTQVAHSEKVTTEDSDAGTNYPQRTSWWTVGKRYPNREAMVKHLAIGQHEGVFALSWLDSLTREELHALHSDDHENKINWNYAVRPVEVETNTVSSSN